MAAAETHLMTVIRAIVVGDEAAALRFIAASPALVPAKLAEGATRQAATAHYLDGIQHYAYEGDMALHFAAAAYREALVRRLIAAARRDRAPPHAAWRDAVDQTITRSTLRRRRGFAAK